MIKVGFQNQRWPVPLLLHTIKINKMITTLVIANTAYTWIFFSFFDLILLFLNMS